MRDHLKKTVAVIVFALASQGCALAQSPVSLFDGQTLEGWKVTEENPQSFRVVNGAIIAHGPRAHLFYEGAAGSSFENFELSLKVMTTPGSNSGVFFHTAYQAENWPKKGFEAQVNATQGDFRKTGSIYATADIRVYDAAQTVPKLGHDTNVFVTLDHPPQDDNEWFDYVIRVEDGTITTSVNGTMLVKWTQPSDWNEPDKRLGSGTFALQAHDPDSLVYFKDIFLTELE